MVGAEDVTRRHSSAAFYALGRLEGVVSMLDGTDAFGLTITDAEAVVHLRAITAELAAALDTEVRA